MYQRGVIDFCTDKVDEVDAENVKVSSSVNPSTIKDTLEFVGKNLHLDGIELKVVCSESFLPELVNPERLDFSKEEIRTRVSQVEGLE